MVGFFFGIIFLFGYHKDSGYIASNNELIEYDTDSSIFVPNNFNRDNITFKELFSNDAKESILDEIKKSTKKKQKLSTSKETVNYNFCLLNIFFY